MINIDKNQIKLLSKLAELNNKKANEYLANFADNLRKNIKTSKNNDGISEKLKVLEKFIYRVPQKAIVIIKNIISRKPLKVKIEKIQGITIEGISHEGLIVQCIELLDIIRYLKPKKVFNLLIRLSIHSNKDIKSKALDRLSHLSKYNFHVLKKIGYGSQLLILDEIEKWNDQELLANLDPLLEITGQFLEPSYEGSTMKDYETLTLHFGPLSVTKELKEIRQRTMTLLKKLYFPLNNLIGKEKILQVLQKATYTPHQGIYGKDMEQMVLENTKSIVDFYIRILPRAENEIIKNIEEQARWFRKGVGREKLPKIDKLQSVIAKNKDYEIFRLFVGYDYKLSDDSGWKEDEKVRKDKIQKIIKVISKNNLGNWQKRILFIIKNYPSTDPGEFQYFYYFIDELGRQKPKIAFKLLTESEKELEPFLTSLIRGIWESKSRDLARDHIFEWIRKGKHLSICASVFAFTKKMDKVLLKKIFAKAKEVKDVEALNAIIQSVVRNYSASLKNLFVNTIKELTKNENTQWIDRTWYKTDFLITLDKHQSEAILDNLVMVPRIDYHAEEILIPIAEKYPEKIIDFFHRRIQKELKSKKIQDRHDAVPFKLHKLREILSKKSDVVIPAILEWYKEKETFFHWEASHFLQTIFPSFDKELEVLLINFIKSKNKKKIEIVISVLRAYKGEKFLHKACKNFVKVYSDNEEYKKRIMAILSQEGMVTGEYGFVDAYKRKKVVIQSWKKDESKAVREFAKKYEKTLDQRIVYEKKQADEEKEARKTGMW